MLIKLETHFKLNKAFDMEPEYFQIEPKKLVKLISFKCSYHVKY